ncbi:MAG: hypothetical protein ACI3V5_08245 [Faecousia sp.]
MGEKIWNFIRTILIFAVVLYILNGIDQSNLDKKNKEISEAKQEAYDEGYNEGYEAGYDRGAEDQRRNDCEELTIDGYSIQNIVDIVVSDYGMTPSEAFRIVEDYEYDPSHGEVTLDEYKKAIEAIYCTASVFPSE